MSDSAAVSAEDIMPLGGLMAWLTCLSAGLFFFYEFFQLNIFDVINQPLRNDFNLNAAQLSWMSSTFLWADILFLLPAGLILDRVSVKNVIIVSMSVCILGTVGFSLSNSFMLACFFHFLSGIGNAFCFLSCVVLVSQWFPSGKQALVIGTLVTMAFIGGMMAHTPFAYLNDHYGWRHSLLIDGAIGALLLLWIVLVLRESPESKPKIISAKRPFLPDFLEAISNKQNWLAGFYTSFLNLPIMVLCALWGVSYLQVVHNLDELAASNVVSLIYIGSIIGCPFIGWLSDSQGKRKPLMLYGAIITLLCLFPLFMNWQLSQLQLSIIFFCLGFCTSTQVISYPLVAESNKAKITGTATSIASILIMGGGGLAQVLFGWLMHYHTKLVSQNYAVVDFNYAMRMFPVAIIAALLAILLTRETYCKKLS